MGNDELASCKYAEHEPLVLERSEILRRLEGIMADVSSLVGELDGQPFPARAGEISMTSDRLLTVDQVAERLGVSRSHVYRQATHWPFTRKLSAKALRFSELGLERWVASSGPPVAGRQEGSPGTYEHE